MDLRAATDLLGAGRIAEAEEACRALLAANPSDVGAQRVFGLALGLAGRHDEAAAHFAAAVRLDPDDAQSLHNLGVAFERIGRLDAAVGAYRRAVALKPNYADAHHGLGNALRQVGRLDDAVASHRRAIALRPNQADAHASLARARTELGLQHDAIESYRRAVELRPDSATVHSNLLYALHYDPSWPPPRIFEEHRRWADRHAVRFLPTGPRPEQNSSPDRPLRIGYVSPDFRRHAICRFVEPLLAHHDRGRFEVFCYADVRKPDDATRRLRAVGHQWRDWVGLSDERAAEMVRDDRIDILVDLAGHGAGNRLLVFARKPSPVQAAMIGYPDTTGMSAVEYRITDADQDPPGTTEHLYAERLVRLPRPAWCYRPDPGSPPVSPPPALANGYVTFGCLNNLAKVTAPALSLWAEILSRVPGSRLLLALPGGDAANPSARARIERCGVPGDRLLLLDKAADRHAYLVRYARVDIALDAFPYNGATTTCDALWMGVPVVTLAGRANVSRAGASLVTACGLPELACSTPAEYADCAARLARDPDRLLARRSQTRDRMAQSPLRDECAFTRAVEAAYRLIWADPPTPH